MMEVTASRGCLGLCWMARVECCCIIRFQCGRAGLCGSSLRDAPSTSPWLSVEAFFARKEPRLARKVLFRETSLLAPNEQRAAPNRSCPRFEASECAHLTVRQELTPGFDVMVSAPDLEALSMPPFL